MQTDVQSICITGSDEATDFPTRLKAIYILNAETPGTLNILDGGSGGDLVMQIDVNANMSQYLLLPGEGIRCKTSMYVEFQVGIQSVTVFYG